MKDVKLCGVRKPLEYENMLKREIKLLGSLKVQLHTYICTQDQK